MVEVSSNVEEELRKKSEEIRFLNEQLHSLKTNFLERSKKLDNLPNSISQRARVNNENNRMKHYSLDPDFLKNNSLPRAENQENIENQERLTEYEKMNKLLVATNNDQDEQIHKMAKKMEFLTVEFEKSLKEKTQILQEQMKLLKDNSDFIKENQFLHNQNKKLLLDIEGMNVSAQKEKKEKDQLLKDVSMRSQEIESLKKEIQGLNDKNLKNSSNLEKLKTEHEGVIANKMKMIEAMSMEMNKSMGELNDFRQKYQNLLDNKKMMEKDSKYLRDKNEELEFQLKSFQEKFVFEDEKKEMESNRLKKELEAKNAQLKVAEKILSDYDRELQNKDQKIKSMEEKYLVYSKEIEVLNSQKWALKKQNDNLTRENHKLSTNWDEHQGKITDYEKRMEEMVYSYTLQRNKILAEYKELSYKCEELESELKNYKSDPDSSKLQEINKKIEEVHAIHSTLDEQVKTEEAKRGECVIQ